MPFQFHEIHKKSMLNRRPRLLFLAHRFPPASSSGCVRTWNTAKYMTKLGWDVTVVTPHPSVWKHVENPEKTHSDLKREGIQRILTGHQWRCLMPDLLDCWNQGLGWFAGGVCRRMARHLGIDNGIGWMKAVEWSCSALTAEDVDIVLATGTPFTAFKVAKRLSDKFGWPYILDYRDPWAGNPHRATPARASTIREEAQLLAGCAAVTIVSRSWALAMDRRFGLGSKVHVVTNGYDPEELAGVRPYGFGHFAIVYTGLFYPPKRVISPVMAALKRLKETLKGKTGEWYFHYYGDHEDHVREEAKRFGVMEQVILHGQVPRTEALSAVRGAGVAVVISSVVEEVAIENKGIVPAKAFEALGVGTPILLVAPPGSDIEAIIETTGMGRRCAGSDIDGIASFLADAMHGRIPESKDREVYAWTNIVKKMDAILRTAISPA
jgi:glycosyltransferase involved in cell wall biosynthesis